METAGPRVHFVVPQPYIAIVDWQLDSATRINHATLTTEQAVALRDALTIAIDAHSRAKAA